MDAGRNQRATPAPASGSASAAAGASDAMDIDKPADVVHSAEALFFTELNYHASLLERSVTQKELHYVTRVLRTVPALRKSLKMSTLESAITRYLPASEKKVRDIFLKTVHSQEQISLDGIPPAHVVSCDAVPELSAYLGLLVILHLHDTKSFAQGQALSAFLVEFVRQSNRRTLDQLAARIFFYYGRFHELLGLPGAEIRPFFHALLRTACLRGDVESSAVLNNLLLRSFLADNLVLQAEKFASRSEFPEYASNNQTARCMYYLGRINAINLDYTVSHSNLQLAIRKSPQSKAARGFMLAATKLSIIVQLLMGEIPDRAVFRSAAMRGPLECYKQIVNAVRNGDLVQFQATLATHNERFATDKTLTLIQRLRHNVIKTGIRLASLSYSRISLRDLCLKLSLESEEDAEYMVAKSIRDGVIDATIDHVNGQIRSKEVTDMYATNEPLSSFHQRINFCLDLHNESVKAMRYPSNVHKGEFTDNEQIRELEKELQSQLEEGEGDDF